MRIDLRRSLILLEARIYTSFGRFPLHWTPLCRRRRAAAVKACTLRTCVQFGVALLRVASWSTVLRADENRREDDFVLPALIGLCLQSTCLFGAFRTP